jgi:cytochrome c
MRRHELLIRHLLSVAGNLRWHRSAIGRIACICLFYAITLGVFTSGAAAADPTPPPGRATKEEVVAFVKKAVEYFKTNGSEKATAEFSNPKGKFIDRDLSIFVYDSTGICRASGTHNRLIGQNRTDQQDADGVYYVAEMTKLMKTQSSFWTHYKYPDPLTHTITPKTSYCEVVNDPTLHDLIICSGTYDAKP